MLHGPLPIKSEGTSEELLGFLQSRHGIGVFFPVHADSMAVKERQGANAAMPYAQMILFFRSKLAVKKINRIVEPSPVVVKCLQYQRGLRGGCLEVAQLNVKIVAGIGLNRFRLARHGSLAVFHE